MRFKTSASIDTIKPYEAGKPIKEVEREYHIANAIKLASNENPFGFSPKVNEAVAEHMGEMHRYPESSPFLLLKKLSEKLGVPAENIVVGNGSDDIIALLAPRIFEFW